MITFNIHRIMRSKHILSVIALFFHIFIFLCACDDTKMEWVDADSSVAISDIPLELAEKIANYDYIKTYAQQYTPNMTIGIGLGADEYIAGADYRQVCDDNFQLFVTGNAMKHQSVVGNSGTMTFTTIDNWLNLVPANIDVYGHNFIWHTQQNQTYLKSLIAPTMNVETDGGGIANVLSGDASTFDGGTSGGWGSWGGDSYGVEDGEGVDGTPCMVLYKSTDGNAWDAQFAYTFSEPLVEGETYVIKFEARSSSSAGQLQFQYQNGSTYGSQGGYNTFDVGTDWVTCEYEFTMAYDDANRIILNFGAVAATYYVDNIEFGLKVEASDPMINVLAGDDSDFDGGTTGAWGSWGGDEWGLAEGAGPDGSDCVYLYKSTDGNAWDAQFAYTFSDPLTEGETYVIQFEAKSDTSAGQLQFQYQNGSTYGSQGGYNTFDIGTDWITCEYEFTMAYDDANRIILNFGAVAGTYYVDNIKFGVKVDDGSGAPRRKATTIYYTLKTAEEKKAILLDAMEAWIQGISEHIQEQIGNRLVAWDVINEPITDNGYYRGIDNHFGGTDDDGIADSAPTETTEDGLELNWANGSGNGHFYWGYYLGMDYATKAFEYARKYNPNALLFVNEYNLETSPSKLAKLIEFVNYIDQNGTVKVDGIGTQMHVTTSITEDEVRTMFSTLAATGKMIRVTELDVSIGTTSPSADQLEEQANVYEMIVTAYRELIPTAQQSGITCWTLSDATDEHTYWLSGDSPNLFDANYGRKHAYKGFCDGLAGYDISTDFTGDDWKTAYETTDEEE